jgi:hypothetical protein
MGLLESRDGHTARCLTHGGQFQVLFLRQPPPPRDPNVPPVVLAPNAMCANHPSVSAVYACGDCGKAICGTCAFDQPDGGKLCPSCAQRRATDGPPIAAAAPRLAAGLRCVQHPHLQATAQCKSCGAFMCDTCKFDLPGGISVCPTCATTPRTNLSPKRKKMLIGSYALALWCTLVMGALLSGAFARSVKTKADQQALGLLLTLLLLGPSITGLALGVGTMDRRLHNTMAMWIAAIWNGMILAGFILLMIIGLMSGG